MFIFDDVKEQLLNELAQSNPVTQYIAQLYDMIQEYEKENKTDCIVNIYNWMKSIKQSKDKSQTDPKDIIEKLKEEYLIDNLIFLFKDLLKYVDLSKLNIQKDDKFFRFELISKEGGVQPQIVTLNIQKENKALELEKKINLLLSGDNDIEVFALLNILKKKMNHE